MSESYIQSHFEDIKKYGNIIENKEMFLKAYMVKFIHPITKKTINGGCSNGACGNCGNSRLGFNICRKRA